MHMCIFKILAVCRLNGSDSKFRIPCELGLGNASRAPSLSVHGMPCNPDLHLFVLPEFCKVLSFRDGGQLQLSRDVSRSVLTLEV